MSWHFHVTLESVWKYRKKNPFKACFWTASWFIGRTGQPPVGPMTSNHCKFSILANQSNFLSLRCAASSTGSSARSYQCSLDFSELSPDLGISSSKSKFTKGITTPSPVIHIHHLYKQEIIKKNIHATHNIKITKDNSTIIPSYTKSRYL